MASKILKLDCRNETEEGEETERGNWDGMLPELLEIVFNHLLVVDLLSCSVVSKTWKKASRDVLKRSRECYAYIKNFPQDVYDLIDKSTWTDLIQMVNGLHIKIRPKGNNNGNSVAFLSSSSSSPWQQELGCSNMDNLKLKDNSQVDLSREMRYLTLDMDLKCKWKEDSCFTEAEGLPLEDAALLRELISDTSESLQKLVIWQDCCCGFMSSCGKEFSKLKVVQTQYDGALAGIFLEEFLTEFAPNVEEITGGMMQVVDINHEESQFILKRSKNLCFVYHYGHYPNVFWEGYRCISGLHRLDIQICQCDSFDDNDNVLFSILLKSLNTLVELSVYIQEFYNFFKTSDQLKFLNLRRLRLATHDRKVPLKNEIASFKQLKNLSKLCPKLEQVKLTLHQGDHEDGAYYNEQDFIPAALLCGADQSHVPLQIEFKYRQNRLSHEYFEFLNKISPKISKVCMLYWEPGKSLNEISSIFSDIPSLELLEINVYDWFNYAVDLQIDALLSGISIEQVEFLFNSSPPTANAELSPSIVPTRPSLFNAKNLKELKIICGCGWPSSSAPTAIANRSWVIQVTENLPVRHVRSVKVTFEGMEDLYDRLNRLRAFRTLLFPQDGP